jgi:membrane protease YdiL (CAAX protease family)
MLESDASPSTIAKLPTNSPIKLQRTEILVVAIFVESVYWLGTRLVLQYFSWETYTAELLRTALRLGSASLIFWLYRDLILSRIVDTREFRKSSVVGSLFLFMAVPLFLQHHLMNPAFAMFFAFTAMAVGIKEEILFRGVIQNYLMHRLGFTKSVLLTSFLFAVWHVGVGPTTFPDYAHIFLASVVLGVLYVRTGSILLTIATHVAYDTLFALPNFFDASKAIAFSLLLYSVALICFGAKSSKLKHQ